MSSFSFGKGYVWHLLLPTLCHVTQIETRIGEPGKKDCQRGTESTGNAIRSDFHDGHHVSELKELGF